MLEANHSRRYKMDEKAFEIYTSLCLFTIMATKLAVGSLLIPSIAHRGLNEETLYSDQASSSSTSLGIPFDFREAFTFSRRSFSRSSVAVSVGDRSYSRATCSA